MLQIKHPRKILIITDCYDVAYNEMYQTIWNHLDSCLLEKVAIDPVIKVKNFSLVNASFIIRLMGDLYPPESIFLVVVSSLGTSPERIIIKTNNNLILVGNNSGYFWWIASDFGVKSVYKNYEDKEKDFRSFGGKYVQAPTVAKIINGTPLDSLGERSEESSLKHYKILDGTVVHCDNFGLMKIKSPPISNMKEGKKLKIKVNGVEKITATYTTKLKSASDGEWVLFQGSSLYGMPELGKVRCPDSAREIDVKEGDIISWEEY